MQASQDPVKRGKLYEYLKAENLTDLSFEEFSTEYGSNSEKQARLFEHLKGNKLTDLDADTFSNEYFGDIKKKNQIPVATSPTEGTVSVDPTGSSATTEDPNKNSNPEEPIEGSINKLYEFEDANKDSLYEADLRSNAAPDPLKNASPETAEHYSHWKSQSMLSSEELAEIDAQIENETKGDFGGLSNAWTSVKEFVTEKVSTGFTPLTRNYVDTREVSDRATLIEQKIEQKRTDYLDALDDPEARKALFDVVKKENFYNDQNLKDYGMLIEKDYLTSKAMEERSVRLIENHQRLVEGMKGAQDPNQLQAMLGQAEQNEAAYRELMQQRNAVLESLASKADAYENYSDNIGTFKDELTLFIENYQWASNQKQTLRLGIAETANGAKYQYERAKDVLQNTSVIGGVLNPFYSPKTEGVSKTSYKKEAMDVQRYINKQRELIGGKVDLDKVETVGDALQFVAETNIESIPTMTQLMLPGGSAFFLLTQQANNEIGLMIEKEDREKEIESLKRILDTPDERNKFSDEDIQGFEMRKTNLEAVKDLTSGEMAFSAFASAGVELGLMRFGKRRLIRKGKRVLKSIPEKELQVGLKKAYYKTLGKEALDLLQDVGGEGFEEGGIQLFDNVKDKYWHNNWYDENGKEKSILDNVVTATVTGGSAGLGFSGATKVVANTYGAISTRRRKAQVAKNTIEFNKYLNLLKEEGLDPVLRSEYLKKAQALKDKNVSIIKATKEGWDGLSSKDKEKIRSVNSKITGIAIALKKLKGKDDSISEQTKSDLNERLERLEQVKEELVYKNDVFNQLPSEERLQLKEQAAKELQAEKDPNSNYTITDAELTERAILNYQKKQEATEDSDVVEESDGSKANTEVETQEVPQETEAVEDTTVTETPGVEKTETQEVETPLDETIEPAAVDSEPVSTEAEQSSVVSEPIAPDVDQESKEVPKSPTVKRVKSVKNASYDVEFDATGEVVGIKSVKDGRSLEEFVEAKRQDGTTYLKKNANYTKIKADATGVITDNQAKKERQEQIRSSLQEFVPSNAYDEALLYLLRGGKVLLESSKKETGLSSKEVGWASAFKSKDKKKSIEATAEDIMMDSTLDLDVQDVRNALIDLISNNESVSSLQDAIIEQVSAESAKNQEAELRAYLSGLNPKEMANFESQFAEDSYLEDLSEAEVNRYFEEEYKKTQGYYEKENPTNRSTPNDTGLPPAISSTQELYGKGGETSEPSSGRDQGGTRRGTLQEASGKEQTESKGGDLKSLLDQGNIKSTLDYLDGLKIDPKDTLNSTLPYTPQAWNAFIEALKLALKAGNTLQKAIKMAANSLKYQGFDSKEADAVAAKFSADQNVDAAAEPTEKTTPKSEPKSTSSKTTTKDTSKDTSEPKFKRKTGKKSVLGRLLAGDNSETVLDALRELDANYTVRSQEKSYAQAQELVKKIGVAEALLAVKNGEIKEGDVETFVLSIALDSLATEIDSVTDLNEREGLIAEFQAYQNFRDARHLRYGQGNAALNFLYNQDAKLKYSLEKQLSDYKRDSVDGKVPDAVLKEFKEIDARLKDVEARMKDAEARAKKAEDALAIKNIQEDIARKKKLKPRNSRKNRDAAEVIAKKILEFRVASRPDIFSSATPATLVWDGAISVVAQTVRAGGTIADAVSKGMDFIKKSEWYKSLTKNKQSDAEAGYLNYFNKGEAASFENVKRDSDGNLVIPTDLFRYHVEQGETDIDVIASKIKAQIKEEFPDADVREIRDALSEYGKRANPTKDDIKAEMARLRSKNNNLQAVDVEAEWESAMQKIHQRLLKQIEDIDTQIANKERRTVRRSSIVWDQRAKDLKAIRDEKSAILDDLVGTPELTNEQKISRAEKALERSIEALEGEIESGDVAYKTKPTPLQSAKLKALRKRKKDLLAAKEQIREEQGLVEAKRLAKSKQRVRKQLETLKERLKNRDFTTKEVKPVEADAELNELKVERNRLRERYDKAKYRQDLASRSRMRVIIDNLLETFNIPRAVKASLDLGLIGIQLRSMTYAELWRSPRQLGKKLVKMFEAIGSQKKSDRFMDALKTHPYYDLAAKLDIGMTYPDFRDEVREEASAGGLVSKALPFIVDIAVMIGGKKMKRWTSKKRKAAGDYILRRNREYRGSIREQSKNINITAIERGLSTYGNVLRFEEFVRGVERLKQRGKDPLNDAEHYKDLASMVRTFSGRAKPGFLANNQKASNVVFFSLRNAVSIFQQLNIGYYAYLQRNNFKEGNYKPSVANQMAMSLMFKSVASSLATMAFMVAGYNTIKDEDDEEMTIETDPRSSDFMKLKIGNFRIDFFGGFSSLITLYARLLTEEVKDKHGEVYKMGERWNAIDNRGIAILRFAANKFSPSFSMFVAYLFSEEKEDKETGEMARYTPWNKKLSEDEVFDMFPIFMGSVKEAVENDFEGVELFLTAYSVFGLGNTQYYD